MDHLPRGQNWKIVEATTYYLILLMALEFLHQSDMQWKPILLMEEILHQLIGSLSHSLQGFIHPRWCRIPSINSNSEIKYQTLLVLGVGFLKLQVAYLPSTISWVSKGSVDGSETRNNHRLDVQNLVNNGVNYQPELVSWISEPSTVLLHSPAPSLPFAISPCWASKQIANAW